MQKHPKQSKAGKVGGPARAKALSPERRSEIARMGALKAKANRERKRNISQAMNEHWSQQSEEQRQQRSQNITDGMKRVWAKRKQAKENVNKK